MTIRRAQVRSRAEIQAEARVLASARVAEARVVGTTTDSHAEPAQTGKAGELWLYGVVGGWWSGFDSESVADALRGMDVDTLTVRLNSPGGRATEGIAIANLLRNHRASVTVVVDGLAASAASVIALGGDEVVMCPGSQFMIHEASTGVYGNAEDLREAADWIDGQSKNYATVYAAFAGGEPDEWRKVMQAETWYLADEAVEAGLATRVGNVPAVSSPPTLSEEEDDLDDDEVLASIAHDLALLDECVHADARAVWEKRPKPPVASASGSPTKGEEPAVAFSDEQITNLRNKLGVAGDADEATILAALDEALAEQAEPTAPPAVPEGMALVDATTLSTLQAQARAGAEAREQQRTERRDRALDAAIAAGKFAPARRDHWAAAWNADPEGTAQALDSLAAGLIPVEEKGTAGEAEAKSDEPSEAALAAYAAQLGISKEALRG